MHNIYSFLFFPIKWMPCLMCVFTYANFYNFFSVIHIFFLCYIVNMALKPTDVYVI